MSDAATTIPHRFLEVVREGQLSSQTPDPVARMTDRLDRELEVALLAADREMQSAGYTNTAKALRIARDSLISWRETMLRRLLEMNVVMLPREQHDALLAMVASEMVEKAIMAAQTRQTRESQAFWTTRAAKVTFISGSVGLLLMALGQFWLIFHGAANHVALP